MTQLEKSIHETVVKLRNIGCAGRAYDPKYDGAVYHINEQAEVQLKKVLMDFAASVQVDTIAELESATKSWQEACDKFEEPVIVPPSIPNFTPTQEPV